MEYFIEPVYYARTVAPDRKAVKMKLLSLLTIILSLTVPLLAQTAAPVPREAEAKAKQELEEAAVAYRQGDFAGAQAHSEKALLLDPQNKTAPYFVARTIHAQYKPGDYTPENVAKAREAIGSYQRILERVPHDDEAYKAVAYLYGAIKEEELLNEWILRRAADVSFPNDKRAEAFVVLASKYWDCSFKITEEPGTKVTTTDKNNVYVTYRRPKDPIEFERIKVCADRGLEMVNMAIILTPESESAWSYKTNIILEQAKLAEMSGNAKRKAELQRLYEEALSQTKKLSKQSESKP
jgi:tetratricopeptide (TPR) repeat protein